VIDDCRHGHERDPSPRPLSSLRHVHRRALNALTTSLALNVLSGLDGGYMFWDIWHVVTFFVSTIFSFYFSFHSLSACISQTRSPQGLFIDSIQAFSRSLSRIPKLLESPPTDQSSHMPFSVLCTHWLLMFPYSIFSGLIFNDILDIIFLCNSTREKIG
jgi:hypothetical protein